MENLKSQVKKVGNNNQIGKENEKLFNESIK